MNSTGKLLVRKISTQIPVKIKNELLHRLNVDTLKNVRGEYLVEVTASINGALKAAYANNKNVYSKYFSPSKKTKAFFSEKSIYRYFHDEPIRIDKLYALLAFLKYQPENFESALTTSETDTEKNLLTRFIGCWFVYVHDSSEAGKDKVIRTPLFLRRKNKDVLVAEYESVRGIRFFGDAEVSGNSIILKLTSNKGLKIFFMAEVPERGASSAADEWILNGALLSNAPTRKTIIANIILSKNYKTRINSTDDEEIKKYLDKKAVSLIYDDDGTIKGTVADENEKLIIDYLARNKDKGIKSFLPNSFSHLRSRNSDFYKRTSRENYDRLKLKLKNSSYIFYAFNRFRTSRNEVGIFSYTFEFNDPERICTVIRHPIDNPVKIDFIGMAFLESEKLYFEMKDTNVPRQMQFIAPFITETEKPSHSGYQNLHGFLFKGITSTVSAIDGRCMAMRELLLCINASDEALLKLDKEDKTNGYISYKKFCAIDTRLLTDEQKLFLANQALSTLSYPSDTNARFTHARQDKARKYNGLYEVYTKNNNHILKMILLIDPLSQVTLKVKYDNRQTSDVYIYQGLCEFYNHNLHINAHLDAPHPSEQKHSEFIFDYIKDTHRKPLEYFKGIHLTTDEEGNAFASKFIACKISTNNIASEYDAQPGTATINALLEKAKALKAFLGINIEKYLE